MPDRVDHLRQDMAGSLDDVAPRTPVGTAFVDEPLDHFVRLGVGRYRQPLALRDADAEKWVEHQRDGDAQEQWRTR